MAKAMLSLFQVRGFSSPSATLFQQWVSQDRCPICKSKISVKSPTGAEMWIGSTGSKWTDVISSLGELLLHERVVEVIKSEGLSGFTPHPVKIDKIENKKLAAQVVPKYYLIETIGRFDIDPQEIDDDGGSICPKCFYRNPEDTNRYRWSPKRLVPELQTWDGSDFVAMRNLRNAQRFCSKRFIDLACEHRWTNFIFGESLPGICLWEKPQKAINGLSYWDKNWFEKLALRVKAKHSDLFTET